MNIFSSTSILLAVGLVHAKLCAGTMAAFLSDEHTAETPTPEISKKYSVGLQHREYVVPCSACVVLVLLPH